MPWEGLSSLKTQVENKHRLFASGMRKSRQSGVTNRPRQNCHETQQKNRNTTRPSGKMKISGKHMYMCGPCNVPVIKLAYSRHRRPTSQGGFRGRWKHTVWDIKIRTVLRGAEFGWDFVRAWYCRIVRSTPYRTAPWIFASQSKNLKQLLARVRRGFGPLSGRRLLKVFKQCPTPFLNCRYK